MIQLDDKGVLSVCPHCGQKNRISFAHLGQLGRCGRCKAPLPAPSQPLEINHEAQLADLVAVCPLPVLVDYWAPWCGPCQMVAPELAKVAAAGAGHLIVAKVNTEALPILAQRFGVRSIPTMAVFLRGREVSRTAGARPAAAIQDFVQQAVEA